VSYRIGKGLVWEHFDLNMGNEFFKQGDEAGDALRRAIFVATNRTELIDKTVGQFAPDIAPIDNHNFVPGQEGYEDVVPDEQGSGDTDAAIAILEDAGYTGIGETLKTPDGKEVPPFRFRYTTGNTIRQQEGELLASYIKPLGLSLKIQPTDDLGGTLGEGDFDIIVFAWVGTPFPFTGAQQLWSTGSGSNFVKFESKESDKLLADAAANTDPVEAASQLNESNKILAAANAVLPLYQKPTFLAVYNNLANIRDNATAVGPTYNVGEWGTRAQAQ
jgi:peptide/nickel transport system substrate-binding protein